MKRITLTSTVLLWPLITWAHEGHGVFENTAWHYAFSFWHILPVILMVSLIVYAVRRTGLRKQTPVK